MEFRVPPGFVLVGASSDAPLPPDLNEHYWALGGGKVAVRSSAIGEDSEAASFAGQYETLLDVEGPEALRAAICRCLESTKDARAEHYRSNQAGNAPTKMNVVVQRMVDARTAGVLFTANPVSARRDELVVDAVPGLGEALVSGHRTPDHWVFGREGEIREIDLQGEHPVLSEEELNQLRSEALRAEAEYGAALDLEWAIDAEGQLYWLQARPITSLPSDPNELDTAPAPGAVYTWCNIGEMMPGAVTPLTFSVTGRGIDIGMQRMYRKLGAEIPEGDELRYVAMFFGHLFLNLSTLAEISAYVAGSTKTQMCLALCGRDVEEVQEPAPASTLTQALNGVRYFATLLRGAQHRQALEAVLRNLSFPLDGSAQVLYRAIDQQLPEVWAAYEHHLLSSAASGAIAPILLGILAKGEEPGTEHHARVAELLAGASDVESADIAAGTLRIIEALAQQPESLASFLKASPEKASSWLRSAHAGEAGQEFKRYLGRHGHRAVRELELRQKEWALDPTPLVQSLQSGLRARLELGPQAAARPARTSQPDPIMRALLRLAHAAVRSREHTKSALVSVTQRFKEAYRALGSRLLEEGLLPDEDLVFFFSHEELGHLLTGDSSLVRRAELRRQALDYQMPLQFPEVFEGRAEPIHAQATLDSEGGLLGKPVSRGRVTGRARVVHTPEQAFALQAGEILIAPITDVGWTPYFALIAGLATDVGSAVSHGAVVAREYGLPAVVNLRTATTRFRTGDWVTLDGDRGLLEPTREPID
jgi:phosphohistidine swiveling domain-containing protein